MPVMKGETRNSYPFETKMSAVKAHVEDGMTSAEAMKAYGIKSKSAFFRWCATYRDEGRIPSSLARGGALPRRGSSLLK